MKIRRGSVHESPKPWAFSLVLLAAMFLVYGCWVWLDPMKPADVPDQALAPHDHGGTYVPPPPPPFHPQPPDFSFDTKLPMDPFPPVKRPSGGIVIEK
jgi:hypothetical protein